jgi:hypothetical protein
MLKEILRNLTEIKLESKIMRGKARKLSSFLDEVKKLCAESIRKFELFSGFL